jgi:hypothetical protein
LACPRLCEGFPPLSTKIHRAGRPLQEPKPFLVRKIAVTSQKEKYQLNRLVDFWLGFHRKRRDKSAEFILRKQLRSFHKDKQALFIHGWAKIKRVWTKIISGKESARA